MSADNGIYVLHTFNEFRVAYHQGIDNIYGKFDDETFQWIGDDEMIKEYFGSAPIFDELDKALDFAEELSYSYDYLEYGICLISDFENKVFDDL